jgi:DNA-binding CsgD family transcriptional regulator
VATRPRTTRLIRRERELLEVVGAAEAVVAPSGSLMLLSGDAGVGKTRLLDEVALRLEAMRVVRGGCVEGVAYAPWTDAMWWLLRNDPTALDALPKGMRGQLARLMPHLDITDVPEAEGQHVLFEAVAELLTRASAVEPIVLVLDDVHWIDPASAELLRYIVQNLRRIPVLVVAAFRPVYEAELADLFAVLGRIAAVRLALEPLDASGAAEMAAQLLECDLDAPEVQRIVHAAQGNPLFVEELAAAADEDRLPDSLRELLLGTVHRLGTDESELVRIAAVVGPRAPRALLAAVSGFDDARAQASARAAIEARALVVDEGGRGYEFRHALLRQVVLDDLVPDERVALHRRIAVVLAERPATAGDLDRVAELARHWDAVDDPVEALRWSVAAGDQAVRRYAFDAAATSYMRALHWWDVAPDPGAVTHLDHVTLLFAAGDASENAGDTIRGARLAREALDEALADAPECCVDAVGRAYPLLWGADRANELDMFTAVAMPALDRAGALAQVRFLESVVDGHLREFRPLDALEYAPRMLEAAAEAGDSELEIRAHWLVAHAHELLGDIDRSIEAFERAVALGRATHSFSALALALYNEACAYATIPQSDKSFQLLDEVDELVAQYRLTRYLMPAKCERTYLSCLRGDLARAEVLLSETEELYAEGIARWFRAMNARIYDLFRGEYRTCLDAMDAVRLEIGDIQDVERIAEFALLRVEAYSWLGDRISARDEADQGLLAVQGRCETYWHAWLAMVCLRAEADACVAASKQRALADGERALGRACAIHAGWRASRDQLQQIYPWVHAFSLGADAELARCRGESVESAAGLAAHAFGAIDIPYYATYFSFRQAEAMLEGGSVWPGTQQLSDVRAAAQRYGFAGLVSAASSLARLHQVRLGPGRTTVDGDEALSDREREVLALLAEGKSNAEIAEELFITTRTARAHVSAVLRKLNVATRVEAVADAHRRGLV